MTAKNLGTGGSSLDARFGDGATSSTFPIHLEHVETDYLYLPGNSGNFAALAPSPSLEFVGDIDVSVRVALDNWTAADQTLIGRGYGNGYWFYTTATNIHFSVVLSGGIIYPGVAWSSRPANGSAIWLRATRVASTGVVTFYSGVDGPNEPSWTLIGTTTSTSGNMIYTGSHPVGIGAAAQAGASFAHATGKFYRLIIRNGINGTKVADVDFTTGLESGGQYSIINTSSDKKGIYASTVENLGTGGAQLDAISGTAVDTITNDPLWLGIEESKFVRTPGVAGNYVAVPHSPSLNILGTEGTPRFFTSGATGNNATIPDPVELAGATELDVRCVVALQSYVSSGVSQLLIGQASTTTAANESFLFYLRSSTLRFEASDGTTVAAVTSTTNITTVAAEGSLIAIRVTWRSSDGRVQFFTKATNPTGAAADIAANTGWTQLGTNLTSVAAPLVNIGASLSFSGLAGGASGFYGDMFAAQVATTIDGAPFVQVDFTQQALGSRGFIESTGKLVSLVGNAAQIVDGTTYGFLPGVVGSNWSAPDSAALDIAGDIDIKVWLSMNDWTPAAISTPVGKWNGATPSYYFRINTNGTLTFVWVDSGGTTQQLASSVPVGLADGSSKWIRATLDVNNGAGQAAAKFYTSDDGTTWTQLGTTITGAFGTSSIRVGTASLSIGLRDGDQVVSGQVFRVIIQSAFDTANNTTSKVFDADFTRQLQFASTFTEGSTNLATVTTLGTARIERERNLEMVIRVSMDDWNPDGGGSTQTFIGKHIDGTNWSWFWRRRTDNLLAVWVAPTGTNTGSFQIISSAAPSVVDGQIIWLKVEIDTISGNQYTARFYQAPDSISEPTTWTQIGNTITGTTGPTSFGPSTAPIVIGGLNNTDNLAGTIHQAIVRNGIGGQTVLNLDLSDSITIKNQKYIPGDSFSTIPEAEQFLPNLGTGGTALNARYGSSVAAETSDPLLLTHTGTNYWYRPGGATTNNCSIPDLAAYNPTTTFSITARIAFTDWTPSGTQDIAQRTAFADPNRQWGLFLLSSGALRLQIIPTGSAASIISIDSAVVPVPDGESRWLRVSFNGNDGAGNRITTFEMAADQATEPSSWSLISQVTTAGTISFTPVTAAVFFGAAVDTDAKFYRVIYRVAGTVQIDANFTTGITSGAQTTFTESSPNAATVTINRSTSGRKSVAVVQDVLLFGTDDYLEVPDSDLLDFGASDSFTVMTAVRQWATVPAATTFVAKKTNLATAAGWSLYGTNAPTLGFLIADGAANPSRTVTPSLGSLSLLTGVRDVAADTIVAYLGTTPTATTPDTTTATLGNAETLRVGRLSGVGTSYGDMEFRGSAVWRRALTAAEVALVNTHYTTGPTTESTKLLQEAVWWIDSSIRNVAQINQTNILNPAQAKIDGAYVYTPGTTGNYVSVPHSPSLNILGTEGTPFLSLPGPGLLSQNTETPDQPALDITGDIDVRVDLAADDWSEDSALLSKFGSAGNHSWTFRKVSTGALRFGWSTNGTNFLNATSTSLVPFADGQRGSVRATLDVDNAGQYQVSFFTSTDFVNWTPLGSVVNGTTGPTSIFNGDRPVRVGADISAANTGGKFYRAQIRNGINGTVVFDADFTQQALGSRGFIESTGKLVSLVGNAAQIVDGTTYGFMRTGTGSGWTVPEDSDLDVSSFEIIARLSLNDWATTAINQAIVSKYTNTQIGGVAQRTYIFRVNGRDLLLDYVLASDPSTVKLAYTQADFLDSTDFANGKIGWIRVTRNKDTGVVQFFKAADSETVPTSWTQGTTLGDQLTGDLYNSNVVTTLGAFNEGLSGYNAAGRFYRAIINNNSSGGTKVLDVDFTRQIQFASTFTEGSSQLATVTTGSESRIERDRDLEIVARVALDSWTPSATQIILGKYVATGTQRSYLFQVLNTGSLRLSQSTNGTSTDAIAYTSNVTTGFIDGQTYWVKAVVIARSGTSRVGRFFYAPDSPSEPTAWTQLGTDLSSASAFSMLPSTAPVEIGSLELGGGSLLAGKIYRAIIRNGINGPAVLDIDFTDAINTGGESYIQDTQLEAIPEAEQFLPNLGWGGSVLDARYGASVAAEPTTSDPLLLTHTGTNYLYAAGGASTNVVTIPDSSALDVLGDVDFRCDVALDTYRPSVDTSLFLRGTADPNRYMFAEITTTGAIRFIWYPLGTIASAQTRLSTAPIPYLGGERTWIRIVLDINNGASGHDVIFYISQDGATWVQLGAVVTTAGTTSLPNVTADMRVWGNNATGKIYRCQMLNGINGPAVYDVNFTTGITSGAQTTFTESSPNAATVTISRNLSGRKSVAVVQDVLLFGTDDYLEVPDNALLDFGATDSFTVMTAARRWTTFAANSMLVAKKSSTSAVDAGWQLVSGGASDYVQMADGTGQNFDTETAAASGVLTTVVGVRDRGASTLRAFVGAVSAGTSVDGTGNLANGVALRVGRLSASGTNYADMEFRGSAVWRRALTAAEVALVNTHYTTGPTAASTALMQEAVWWIDAGIRSVAQINRSLSGLKTTAVAKDNWLFGTDKFLQVLNNDALNFKENESFTALAVIRHWPTVQDKRLLGKISLGSGLPQWWLGQVPNDAVRLSMTSNWVQYPTADTRLSPGVLSAVVGIRNVSTDTLSITAAGSTVSTSDTTTGTLVNTVPLLVGAQPGGVYADMEFYGGAIWRRVLTSQEIALINTHYTTGPTTASNALLQEAVWWIDAKQSRSGAGISRSTSGLKSVTVTRPTWLVGNGRYFEVSDNNLLDANATQSFSIFAVVRQWPTPTNYGMYVNKVDSSIEDKGYLLGGHETNNALYAAIDDQPTQATRFDQATKPGKLQMVCMVVDRSVQTLRTYVDGVAGTVANIVSVGSLETGVPLRIGRTASGGTALHADVEIVSVGLFRRALTDKEVIDISAYYGTSNPINEATVLTGEDGNYLLLENGEPIIIE